MRPIKEHKPCLDTETISAALRQERPNTVLTLGHRSTLAAKVARSLYRDARIVAYLTTTAEPNEPNVALPISGINVRFSSSLDPSENGVYDLAILAVSGYEGKQSTTALISQVWSALSESGKLYVFTSKQRGARSQEGDIRKVFGSVERVKSRANNAHVLRATKNAAHSSNAVMLSIPDGEAFTHDLFGRSFSFESDAGVFSRGHIDPGTLLLLNAIPDLTGRRVLDLGCGYGPIGIMVAAHFPDTQITMVDVNVRAIELAKRNAKLNGIDARTKIVLSNGLRNVENPCFDAVLTHFPLHIPKRDLTRIVKEVYDSLERSGDFYGVALAEFDMQPLLKRVFGNVRTIAESDRSRYQDEYRVVHSKKH